MCWSPGDLEMISNMVSIFKQFKIMILTSRIYDATSTTKDNGNWKVKTKNSPVYFIESKFHVYFAHLPKSRNLSIQIHNDPR